MNIRKNRLGLLAAVALLFCIGVLIGYALFYSGRNEQYEDCTLAFSAPGMMTELQWKGTVEV